VEKIIQVTVVKWQTMTLRHVHSTFPAVCNIWIYKFLLSAQETRHLEKQNGNFHVCCGRVQVCLGSSYFCEYSGENAVAGTINNKSIPHNCAGGCVAVPLLRHHSNFTTNKTIVNTEQRVYHRQSDNSENTAG